MIPSLIALPLLLAATGASSAEQAKERIEAIASTPAGGRDWSARYNEPTPMDVLEYASKITDTAGTTVSFAAYVLGAMALLVTGGTFYYQWRVKQKIDEAVQNSVVKIASKLATDPEFAESFANAIIGNEDFKGYLKSASEQIVRETATDVVTSEWIKKLTEALQKAGKEAQE